MLVIRFSCFKNASRSLVSEAQYLHNEAWRWKDRVKTAKDESVVDSIVTSFAVVKHCCGSCTQHTIGYLEEHVVNGAKCNALQPAPEKRVELRVRCGDLFPWLSSTGRS